MAMESKSESKPRRHLGKRRISRGISRECRGELGAVNRGHGGGKRTQRRVVRRDVNAKACGGKYRALQGSQRDESNRAPFFSPIKSRHLKINK